MSQDPSQLVPVLADDGTMDERETVFQVWAFLADRSPKRAAELAAEHFGIDVSAGLVSTWARRHGWDLKARELFEETAPTFFERTRAALVAAGPPAAAYLRNVVSGTAPADRAMIVAAAAVLDRIGFLPFTRREAEKGHTPIAHTSTDDEWADLSDAELQAIVSGRVAQLPQ